MPKINNINSPTYKKCFSVIFKLLLVQQILLNANYVIDYNRRGDHEVSKHMTCKHLTVPCYLLIH